MKVLDVLYYHYYQFYSKVLKDNEPHLLTTLAISASQSFFLNFSINIVWANLYCRTLLDKWGMIFLTIMVIALNYLIFHFTGRAKRVIINSPKLLGSNSFSRTMTLIFFLVTTSFLFWGPIYLRNVFEQCR
jgi:hypothetical protein